MRIKELDSLRGLAAFAVFLFHFQLFDYGYLGVHLFFIISGFVIYLTANSVNKPLDFVIARFSRLYPTYWVCLLLSFGVLYISRGDVTFKQLIFNFTMFQTFLGEKHIDGAYWSLTEELVFYVIIFGALVLGLVKKGKIWAGFMLLLGLGGLLVNPVDGGLLDHAQSVVKYFSLFVAGIIFYNIYQAKKVSLKHGAGLMLCLGISLQYKYGSYLPYFDHKIEMVLICSFFGLFVLLVLGKLAFLQKYKWLLFLGEVSYPFYLLHQEIGLAFRRLFESQEMWVHVSAVAVVFVGVLVMATLINRVVEQYASRLVKQQLKYWFKSGPASPPVMYVQPTTEPEAVNPLPELDPAPVALTLLDPESGLRPKR